MGWKQIHTELWMILCAYSDSEVFNFAQEIVCSFKNKYLDDFFFLNYFTMDNLRALQKLRNEKGKT